MNAIFKREMGSYFLSAVGYIVLASFYFFSALSFIASSIAAKSSDMSQTFSFLYTVTIFIVPIITMRLFSEDKRQKTDQALLTAPIRLTSIVFGKYLAALSLFLICMMSTLLYAFIISSYASPNWSTIFGNFIGLFLLGAALISIGLFISSLTENQIVAAMACLTLGLFTFYIDQIASGITIKFFSNLLKSLSFTSHYHNSFPLGLLKLEDVMFFLSVCGLFIFLTARVFEKKRWS